MKKNRISRRDLLIGTATAVTSRAVLLPAWSPAIVRPEQQAVAQGIAQSSVSSTEEANRLGARSGGTKLVLACLSTGICTAAWTPRVSHGK